MAVYFDLNNLPEFKNPVLTIGSFDGVHHGHKAILKKVVQRADEIGGESVLITFDPHPRKIIRPDEPLGLLTDPDQKYALIMAAGIHHIVVVPFSRNFSMMSASAYIESFLWDYFKPKVIVLGYDHHFGHSREGDIRLLREKLRGRVEIDEIPAQLIDDAAVSSTKIRAALLQGDVAVATEMLERPFSFSGTVIHGEKLGRELGFPTANLRLHFPDIILPKQGIYTVVVDTPSGRFGGMLSIGVRPTVSQDEKLAIEAHLLDFDEDLYGQSLRVYLIAYLRPEVQGPSLEALIELMRDDETRSRRILAATSITDF